ncbi:MAG: 30S ribosomal protein S9 [Bacteroidales bacterium]|jgi:small subunit ribosomal protein S9|nr:30S ribosomal protein S9 [Bacteroidales bacterium]HPB02816.1 30S ribosomal protein S9 [Bacteroidales bacterium]HPF01509.1 30S ribosomal protein S9 [Bacteroidales bacterium]
MSETLTLGRRKTAVARLRLTPGNGTMTVNGRDYKNYFPLETLQYIIDQPFIITGTTGKYDVKALLDGGGYKGQAEALRLAISRALVELNEEYRPALKEQGLMRRDPRMVERKKPGRPKARKRFQFSKR